MLLFRASFFHQNENSAKRENRGGTYQSYYRNYKKFRFYNVFYVFAEGKGGAALGIELCYKRRASEELSVKRKGYFADLRSAPDGRFQRFFVICDRAGYFCYVRVLRQKCKNVVFRGSCIKRTACTPSMMPTAVTAFSARRTDCNTARGWAMLLLELLLGLIRFLLGAALFSFMNVVAWRLPRGMDPLKGRSVCPQCGHTLGAPDLVPVFSWLFLRGRCRHCGAHIPARYLLVELLGGVLALGCTWRYGAAYALPGGLFGMSWAALLALAVCGILLSVSLIDAETQTIPDRLNLALAVCGAVSVLLSPADWLPHIIGALCVSVPMFLLCLVIDGAFGGGDIKLMAAAGLFLGWQNTLLAMFFGIVFGGMYGIYLLAAKKAGKKDHFAFGPFLCAGIVIAMLFGGPVLEWYCAFL